MSSVVGLWELNKIIRYLVRRKHYAKVKKHKNTKKTKNKKQKRTKLVFLLKLVLTGVSPPSLGFALPKPSHAAQWLIFFIKSSLVKIKSCKIL
jgi:hypothetical protein